MSPRTRIASWLVLALALSACHGAHEPHRVELPVETELLSAGRLTTNLGYEVTLDEAVIAISALRFTIGGELHADARHKMPWSFFSRAYAHPGHFQAGDVTGELPGHHVVRWTAELREELGVATLVVGRYEGANLVVRTAREEEHAFAPDDLVGAAGLLRGRVHQEESTLPFTIRLLLEAPVDVVGIPFQATVSKESTGSLRLVLHLDNPFGDDGLLDDIDFASILDAEHDVVEVSDRDDPLLGALYQRLTDHDFLQVTRAP